MVEAVRGISFEVKKGEIFGFLGPNGAGKTTTIKTLLGLIFPTRGEVRLFGLPVTDPAARRRVGFLPENPYLYQYLTPREIMDLCGRLVGMPGHEREIQTKEILRRVGLGSVMDRPLRRFSKGMLQRAGLAQALMGDPELLILDEPMTGLDPIGRKEVRDLILEERTQGRTVMFSSHILSDVEMLCDRVAIVNRGELTAYGSLDQLLRREIRAVEVELSRVDEALVSALGALSGVKQGKLHDKVLLSVEGEDRVGDVLALAVAHNARVHSVTPRRETLEDLFVRNAIGAAAADR
ncbi:MAG: ABC transporter ATP-binding protein [Deltaproteobacteria bacterium]|nr:ABC transporter ATP-binding protein [Deltaproteobacteria bacterium]MBP6833362.1 ABC transporter ATP-binding protein [Deltaproteobacteria bacterium]